MRMSRRTREEKPEEEGLEGRVREALKKSQQQRDELRERMKTGSSSHEETTNASEDLGRGEVPVPSSTWSLEDQRTKGRGPAFITAYGKKWHPPQHMPQNFQCIRCIEAKRMVHAMLKRTKR